MVQSVMEKLNAALADEKGVKLAELSPLKKKYSKRSVKDDIKRDLRPKFKLPEADDEEEEVEEKEAVDYGALEEYEDPTVHL